MDFDFNGALPDTLAIPLLMSLPGFGPASYWRMEQAGALADQWLAQPFGQWTPEQQALVPKAAVASLTDLLQKRQHSRYWQKFVASHSHLLEADCHWVVESSMDYPSMLQQITLPPPVLYVQGNVEALNNPQLAFVGSRRGSRIGLHNSEQLAFELGAQGMTITSGLALGIDAEAHRGALRAQGATVAVMGSGIDRVYPARHKPLAKDIVAGGGAVVSEFPPGTAPVAGNFPRRNRVVSGLSLGVLVVEAALQSGSLITARLALEQNREVFAIPGSINNPNSRGCHALLRDGATLVECAQDIVDQLGTRFLPNALPQSPHTQIQTRADDDMGADLSPQERPLWQVLDDEPRSLDDLAIQLSLPIGELLSLLMSLELKGLVIQEDSGALRAPAAIRALGDK